MMYTNNEHSNVGNTKSHVASNPLPETFGDRIRRLRIQRGLSQPDLAQQLHQGRNSICNWEANRSRPDISKIPEICDILQVSISEFFGRDYDGAFCAPRDQQMLVEFHALDQKNQNIVRNMIHMLHDMQQAERKLIYIDDLRRVYLNSEKASAGTGNTLSDSNGEYVYLHLPRNLQSKADEVITVTGNSMEPTFHDGDELLIEHVQEINYGEIGIFLVDGQGFVKEYQNDGLYSHNTEYQPILFSDGMDVRCVGRVVGVVTEAQYATSEEVALMEEKKKSKKPRKKV